MRLVINSGGPQGLPEWRKYFGEFAPALEICGRHEPLADPGQIGYALVWEPDPGWLASLPNLKLIISSGAGVDHILADPQRPVHVPIARLVTQETAGEMSEFVLAAALAITKDLKRFANDQAIGRWDTPEVPRMMRDMRVGVMGLGYLGAATATLLARTGFPTAGWSRSPARLPGVESYAGPQRLAAFLARTDILVCLLPGTDATRGILGAETFAQLPRGAALISVGRGSHMVEPDLLAALGSGQLSQAVLDVFDIEPLPADSPLWRHPGVMVTPHCAATPTRRERARYVAELIRRCEAGEALPNLYDPAKGY
ncbi:glyoxylate/hydroxypyruvate reductase A [Bordetella sp. BOR01]|uniref:2-hydroxyacid dehydrogenase n=1 Tax=Bordetella sp. BOR01 TaxID=2854779 RepID=UPI001C446F27|nr:glyoxylate/hydroxypyruvate reductase A [Bordetella sp. BOR01]MBV7485398.1 glyoxylate/hydroxypyruvate reductase A [Bordetella sp. BOR01]